MVNVEREAGASGLRGSGASVRRESEGSADPFDAAKTLIAKVPFAVAQTKGRQMQTRGARRHTSRRECPLLVVVAVASL